MASVKATLTVALRADHVLVAELVDPALWQRVMAALKVGDATPQTIEIPAPLIAAAARKAV